MEVIESDAKIKLAQARLRVSVAIPALFVSLLWLVELAEWVSGKSISFLGIYPRTPAGLPGILFAPFIHGDFGHLLSNSIPLLVLGMALIYFYHGIAYRVILLIWLLDGLGVWLIGREAYHIGASGLVYGLASYLFFSGLLRKNSRLLALSLAIVFIYGGIIWGMLPIVNEISWEAHLFGFLTGIFLAVYYLRRGPPDDPVPSWMTDSNPELQEGPPEKGEPEVFRDLKPGSKKEEESDEPEWPTR